MHEPRRHVRGDEPVAAWPVPNNYDGNQPFYCGVPQNDIDLDNAHQWCSMDAYPISSATRNRALSTYMPGVASCLDKHEWFKHGTCSNSASPDAYWNQASGMISRLGNTSFNAFLQANAGKTVTRNQLLSAFEGAFGSNTRSAVSLKCTTERRQLLHRSVDRGEDQPRSSRAPPRS